MEAFSHALGRPLPLTKRRQIGFALAALGLGGGALMLAALIQLAGYLPAAVQANPLFAALVQGYSLIEPLMTEYTGPRPLGLLGVGVGIYWLLPRARWRQVFLLVYSAFLAVALAPIPLLLTEMSTRVFILVGIAVLIVFVHLMAHAGAHRRSVAVGGIIAVAVVYAAILALPLLADLDLVPYGAGQTVERHLILQGFFLFLPLKSIHYLWDVAADRAEACSLETLAQWVLFFPSFRTAPFARIQSFAAQVEGMPDTITPGRIREGLKRILIGTIKGTGAGLVHHSLSPESVWAMPTQASAGQLWLAAYGYAFFIYLVFSGFVDVMIGGSIWLGYRLPENFDCPYLRFDVRGFWRGWNVTASRWLRDYVYIPLGGSRRGDVHLNLVATMLVAGLWHAFRLDFIIWGAWHGLGLVVSRFLHDRRQRAGRPEPSLNAGAPWLRLKWLLGVFVTFHFVTVGWVFHHNGYEGIGALTSLRMVARMFGLD